MNDHDALANSQIKRLGKLLQEHKRAFRASLVPQVSRLSYELGQERLRLLGMRASGVANIGLNRFSSKMSHRMACVAAAVTYYMTRLDPPKAKAK
jgi:hypothetical protein